MRPSIPGYVKYTAHGVPDGDQRNHLLADTLMTPRRQTDIAAVAERVAAGPRADPRRDPQGHRRPGRRHRSGADGAVHRRPLPDHRRAGLAKTLLIKTLAQILDLSFKRIQFTPDLMPADITGTEVLDEEAGHRVAALRARGRSSRRSSWPTRSTARRRRRRRRCSRRCRSITSRPRAGPIRSSGRSSCSRRRTRSSWKAPIRCPRRSSIASCSTS